MKEQNTTKGDISMNELAVFKNETFGSVRVIEREGEPWFVAADVCRALEITNPSVALERLDDDEKMTLSSTEGHSGQRGGAQMLVNEPDIKKHDHAPA